MGSGSSRAAASPKVNPVKDVEVGTEADVELSSSSEDDAKTGAEVSSELGDDGDTIGENSPTSKNKEVSWKDKNYDLKLIKDFIAQRNSKLRQLKTLEDLIFDFQEEANYLNKHVRLLSESFMQKYGEYPIKGMTV